MEDNSFQLTFLILLSQLLYFTCINHHSVSFASTSSFGVTYENKTENVIKIDLRNKFLKKKHELRGVINLSFPELQHFRNLDLSMNKSGGIKVPKFIGRLKELRYLNLSAASFTSSVSSFLGSLSNLQVLDLGVTLALITFPQWIFKLNNLVHLHLSSNNIFSELPDEFAKLTLFEYLDLSSIYGINGTLKRSLGKLCNLKNLILSYNNILET
ncbi:hypothetical protein H5410_031225 [Solanum commersonii]|uniref:Disease resistance R13L4/SHOC-2-like LRR domain-containing protein n=1 Tax=Solanum commersonii TaxID=4109 RepID=A0A9J5YJA5_SOLCO|nr:hypothetical protein H5410_031225 [Solanum commersonii]